MPIVQIHLMAGRSDEKKRALVKAVTEAVCATVDAPPEKVRIILSEMAENDYAVGGVLVKDSKK